MKNITVLGIVTARGGSKSIPRKNIKELGGKPLIGYTIEAANNSNLTRTILSTEDEEIAEISREFGLEVPFMRPQELAEDDSTSMEVVQHALTRLKEVEGKEYDYLLILQPTSPFRIGKDIDACIEIAREKDADSVMSMVELDDFAPQRFKYIHEDGIIMPAFEEENKILKRRQDSQGVYKRNGAVYLTKTEHIMNGDLFGDRVYAYVMPAERSLDINEPFDFDLAEFMLERKKLI